MAATIINPSALELMKARIELVELYNEQFRRCRIGKVTMKKKFDPTPFIEGRIYCARRGHGDWMGA